MMLETGLRQIVAEELEKALSRRSVPAAPPAAVALPRERVSKALLRFRERQAQGTTKPAGKRDGPSAPERRPR